MQIGWWLVLATLVWPAVLSAADAPVEPAVRAAFIGGDHFNLSTEGRDHGTIEHNFTEGDPGFVDPGGGNYQLKDESPVYAQIPGFRKIPFDDIGLYDDEYRQMLPSRKEPR